MHKNDRTLPCGCRLCGCLCNAHSRADANSPFADVCAVHLCEAVLRTILQEAGALVSLTLFVGMVAVWAVVLHDLSQ